MHHLSIIASGNVSTTFSSMYLSVPSIVSSYFFSCSPVDLDLVDMTENSTVRYIDSGLIFSSRTAICGYRHDAWSLTLFGLFASGYWRFTGISGHCCASSKDDLGSLVAVSADVDVGYVFSSRRSYSNLRAISQCHPSHGTISRHPRV